MLSDVKGTKNTRGMSNRSRLRFRDQRARASCFTVAEAVRGWGLRPRRQAQPPATARRHGGGGRLPLGVAAPSPPPASRHIAHLPPAEVPLPDSFPRTKGAGVRPEPKPAFASGRRPGGKRRRAGPPRGGAGGPSGAEPYRTAPHRTGEERDSARSSTQSPAVGMRPQRGGEREPRRLPPGEERS